MILYSGGRLESYIFTFLNSGAIFSAIKFTNLSLLGLELVRTISVNPKSVLFFNSFFPSSFEITSNISSNLSSPMTLPFSSIILGSCISNSKKAFTMAPLQNLIDCNAFSLFSSYEAGMKCNDRYTSTFQSALHPFL